MEVYLVGGAVRDEQLGLPVKEQDWCVVGATPDELLSEGYRQIGKHFPVFLHPETNEEYALARTERKIAKERVLNLKKERRSTLGLFANTSRKYRESHEGRPFKWSIRILSRATSISNSF